MWMTFIGFMGSGKSSVAAAAATLARRRFVDLDALIVTQSGFSIPELFQRGQEEGFRQRERGALESLGSDDNLVLAVGGGLIETPAAVELVRSRGPVVWLDMAWESAWMRLADSADTRPLVASLGETGLFELFCRRRPRYAAAADFRLRSDRGGIQELAATALRRVLMLSHGVLS